MLIKVDKQLLKLRSPRQRPHPWMFKHPEQLALVANGIYPISSRKKRAIASVHEHVFARRVDFVKGAVKMAKAIRP